MMAPTHIAFGLSIGALLGISKGALPLIAGGALLPDIDHPQSAIGRIFFPLSIPLYEYAGHRRAIHSIWIWGAVFFLGFIWRPFLYVGVGALSHILIDCLNLSGVHLLAPWSDKVFVLGSRNLRFPSGSPKDLITMVLLGSIAWGGGYIGSFGGIRALIQQMTGSFQIAVDQYRTKGSLDCYLDATLRLPTGEIKKGSYRILGLDGSNGLVLAVDHKPLRVPKKAFVLNCKLVSTKKERAFLKLEKPVEWQGPATYALIGDKWVPIKQGGMALGYILIN